VDRAGTDGAGDRQSAPTAAHQAANLLARDWLESQGPSDLSTATKATVVLGAAAKGTIQDGLDEICNHTGRTALEIGGAVALGVALRGPAWTRIPAMALATVGTVAYGQQLVEAGINTSAIVGRMNSHNLEESRQGLQAALGPVIFNSALMYAAGVGGTKIGDRLPAKAPEMKLAQTLNLAKDHLTDLVGLNNDGFPPGMSPALAGGYGGGRVSGGFRIESVMPTAKPKLESIMPANRPAGENIMQMSATGGSGGSGDGVSFRTSRGPSGETFTQINDMPLGRPVTFQHGDGALTSIAADGKVTVGLLSGEGRRLDLGQAINRITVVEHPSGLKQFRFNDKIAADLEVDNGGTTIRALLGNGDHMHMMDNIEGSHIYFSHRDGLQSWVEHSGRVVVQLPEGGKVHQVKIPEKLAYIRLLEKPDGSKEFRFLNPTGKPIPQKVQLPPTPELQQIKAPDEVQNWHDLKTYIASRTQAQQNLHRNPYDEALHGSGGSGVHRVEPSPYGTLYPDHGMHGHHPGPFRFPTTPERVMARDLVGVPANIMGSNDLSAPADMELAMQGHGWFLTSYLDRLDFQEEVHHHDW
jgi:hypothetical protein